MEAYVKVGDTSVMVTEVRAEEHSNAHRITLADAWTGETESLEVEGEVAAIEFMRDFLTIDGPKEGSMYRRMVTKKVFLP